MRLEPSILHLDLDAFFAAVEQRDKPSLRDRPVIVGGTGPRGVVATASYEARRYGARSAMPTAEARRRCPPGTAFLAGRFEAYRLASTVVMQVLSELSPVVQQVSVDEAYVDLAASGSPDLSAEGVTRLGRRLLARISDETGGLTASVGIATSKLMAKIGSDLDKPHGMTVVPPGQELAVLHPLPVRVVAGVGPATAARLHTFGVETVGDLARMSRLDLVSILGEAHGTSLHQLARAVDYRPVVTEHETKSLSVEETFDTDVTDAAVLSAELDALSARVGARLNAAAVFGRTITIKVRHHDFSTITRSGTLPHATGGRDVIAREARRLLGSVDTTGGLRLLGVAVSGLTHHAQEELRWDTDLVETDGGQGARSGADPQQQEEAAAHAAEPAAYPSGHLPWRTGQDVIHRDHGAGWVWGTGRGRVTVRFEGPRTTPGPVRTFAGDDPALQPGPPPDWRL